MRHIRGSRRGVNRYRVAESSSAGCRGAVAPRRHSHDLLADVDYALAGVEARADMLLEDFLEFLESETDRAWIDVVE